ncbi:MAG TPA: hypothetical protein VMT92_07670 [Steroidobacteraceae bacterium]|nr:hypothetical protein [Steroidobacteraceae bacterium]
MELEFYSNAVEQDQLLQWVLEQGASLVPDQHYIEPHCVTITSDAELAQWRTTAKFFVVRPDWQMEPLHLRPYIHQTKGGGFYVSGRDGGPSIELALYRAHRENTESETLAGGMIGTYPFYCSMRSSTRMTPNPAFRKFSRCMADQVRRGGRALKIGKRVWWLTAGAWAAAQRDPQQLPAVLRDAARAALD